MADEEVKVEEVNEEVKEPEVKKEDLQAILARLDELAKDIAEVKAKQDDEEDDEYEEIAY